MKKKLTIPLDELDEFGAVLLCAIRYCAGRMTYMPGLVTDWIMAHCHGLLTAKTIHNLKGAIDAATEFPFGLGMDCDKEQWAKFVKWLDEEEAVEQ